MPDLLGRDLSFWQWLNEMRLAFFEYTECTFRLWALRVVGLIRFGRWMRGDDDA